MPRPVVPILALPRKRSVTLSMAMWYGMIRCASALIMRPPVSTPRFSSPVSSSSSTPGSTTTPLPMTLRTPGVRMPDGIRCSAKSCPSGEDDGMACVVATLVADHPLDLATEKVGGLAFALVAPPLAPISTIAGM